MTKHAATDKTPFEVLFGQQPRLEFDAKWGTEARSESTREETLAEVKGRSNAAAGRMKKDYDKRFKAKSARVLDGRRVYWKVPVRKTKRSEEHTSELQSRFELVCRLLLES